MKKQHSKQSVLHQHSRRRGVVLLWLILALPALTVLFGMVVDVGRIWLARIELTNALEAAALSAVKSWAEADTNDQPARAQARQDAIAAAGANTVIGLDMGNPSSGIALVLAPNENLSNSPNNNDSPIGELVLGAVNSTGTPFEFSAGIEPTPGNDYFAVRTSKTVQIYSVWANLFGAPVGPYTITSGAVAIYEAGQPRLAHVTAQVP